MAQPKLRFKHEDGTSYPDWNKKKIGDLANVFSASRVHRDEWQTEGVPFWRSSDVMAFHQHKVNPMGKAYITQELYEKLSSKSGKMKKDDILITGGGSIGIPYLIQDDCPLYVKDADLLCIQKSVNHNSGFLYQFFWSPTFRSYLGLISHKGTIAHYTITQIGETPVAIPCLEEQQKIADFLSTVDEVIAQSEAEVQNLEQQKKAAMQKIFSQEVRFMREDGASYPDWRKDKWSNLGQFVSSGTLSKADLSEEGTPCILYGELYTKYGEIAHTIYSKTNSNSHTFSKKDDVILPKSGETPEDISTATCIPYDDVSLGGDLIVFRHNEKVIGTFLSYLISNRAKNAIASIAQGKSVVHISEKGLANIELSFPCLEEQQKIADFLSAYDEAITCAKQELDKWKELKKGLLQQMFV